MKYLTLAVFILLCSHGVVFAQIKTEVQDETESDSLDLLDDRLDSLDELILRKPYLQIGGSYASQVVYNGRTEGITQYAIMPAATWHIGKGWLINYNGTVWSAAKPSYTYTSVGAAKALKIGDFDAQIGYNRLFFNDSIPLKKADYTHEIEANASYALGNFSFDAYFLRLGGKSTGNYMAPSVSWATSNRFGNKRQYKWHVGPSISAEFGNDEVSQIIRKGKLRAKTLLPRAAKKTIFGLLNYQLSAVAGLKTTTTDIELAYIYNLPKNATFPNTNTAFGYFEIEVTKRFGW